MLHDATIGVVKTGADYALDARGTLELVGFEDVTVGGTVRVRANTFAGAVNETLDDPGHRPRGACRVRVERDA